jgi:hypothetical protein
MKGENEKKRERERERERETARMSIMKNFSYVKTIIILASSSFIPYFEVMQ